MYIYTYIICIYLFYTYTHIHIHIHSLSGELPVADALSSWDDRQTSASLFSLLSVSPQQLHPFPDFKAAGLSVSHCCAPGRVDGVISANSAFFHGVELS
jgi:hypothetical protein